MTKAQIYSLIDLSEEFGFDASLYEGYSGRGMYGKEVDGFSSTCPPSQLEQLIEERNEENEDDALEMPKADSLGKGYIYY